MKVSSQTVGPSLSSVVLLLLIVAGHHAIAGQAGPAPFGLGLQVVYGDDSLGAESLRDDVERWVFRDIASQGCYASMERYRVASEDGEESGDAPHSDSDLLLRIRLTNLDVHESWDVSLAERTSPDYAGGDVSNRVTATVAFDVEMDLLLLPEYSVLRNREYRHHQTYRPSMNEDPREAVRMLVLADLSRDARGFVCKGTKKLPREMERARNRAVD
jgi:hypothetical protein